MLVKENLVALPANGLHDWISGIDEAAAGRRPDSGLAILPEASVFVPGVIGGVMGSRRTAA
jgi:hypothetical protein